MHDLDDPLPRSWGAFDVVVSAFAIHHLVDDRKRALYAEVYEHLEPGGVFATSSTWRRRPSRCEAFFTSFGLTLADDDPSNKLVAVEPSGLSWRINPASSWQGGSGVTRPRSATDGPRPRDSLST